MVAPLIAAALPWIASAVGTMLPAIVDAFRSGKSPDEAKKIIEPHRQEIVDRLVGTGMNQAAAEAMADESLRGELANAQLPEPMNPWLQGALAIGGGIGGFKLGKMGMAKMGAKPAAAAATPASEEIKEPAGPEEDDSYRAGFTSPRAEAMRRGAGDRVTGVGEPKRLGMDAPVREVNAEVMDSGPFPRQEMDRRFAADWTREPDIAPPGVTRGAGFSMRDAGPFPRLGMDPASMERRKAAEIERMYQLRDMDRMAQAERGR